MLVDSHCHLNFSELKAQLDTLQHNMHENRVGHALCISVTLEDFPDVLEVANSSDNLFATVGVHPDYENVPLVEVDTLIRLAAHAKVIGIGETGLDYFRLIGDLEWQRERFRTHIRAAIATQKPLIIHTRNAAEDTIRIMREENAEQVKGVMHCFTESLDIAKQCIDMGFYISISGIVTFKNAQTLKDVVKALPLDRLLVETDSPYLAPVPYRGKTNQPAFVRYVADEIARIKNIDYSEVEKVTTENFFNLFKAAKPSH